MEQTELITEVPDWEAAQREIRRLQEQVSQLEKARLRQLREQEGLKKELASLRQRLQQRCLF